MYQVTSTKRFDKDVERLRKQGVDIQPLQNVIKLLAKGTPLPKENRDHPLKGNQKQFRECHITSSWSLKYLRDKKRLVLVLSRTGTHNDVLRKE